MEVQEEIEALQSIFMDDVGSTEEEGRPVVTFSQQGQPILSLRITENYPREAPLVILPGHLKTLGLNQCITDVIKDAIGSPMLFQIVDAAKEWVSSHPLSLQPESFPQLGSDSQTATPTTSDQPPVCKYFLQGKCKFGNKCHQLHSLGSSPGQRPETRTSTALSPKKENSASISTMTTGSKAGPKKSKKGKGATNSDFADESPLSNQEPVSKRNKQKKAQKDEDADKEEKKAPMRTANEVISRILWDPDLPSEEFTIGYLDRFTGITEKPFSAFSWEDIASVGANVLAIPKHRIQYFKFRDEIVWDKSNQLDNFFGSRGGKTIQEVTSKYSSSTAADSADSTAEETPMIEEDEEIKSEDAAASVASPAVLDKNRPNHFVSIHITDEEVKCNVQKIQDHITGHTPQLTEGCLPVTALHVTLCMIRLEDEQQMENAKQVLLNVRSQFIHILPHCLQLTFSGVDNFRERLVYVRVVPNPALEKFVFFLLEQLHQAGIKTPGNHEQYTPHMTIVKLSRSIQRELHTTLISPASYLPFQAMHIGRQHMDTLHICSMTEPKQSDGFYLRLGSISNSLSGLPPAFSSLVLKRLESLTDQGVVAEYERDQLAESIRTCAGLHPEATRKFDSAIEELLRLSSEETMCTKLHDETKQPVVVILRGLPGSGKSFLAQNCTEILDNPAKVAICGADEYFMEGDSYKFNPDLLPKAHTYCLSQFLNALSNGKELVVIDNTNSKLWEYQIYTYLCEILGLKFHILEVPCPNTTVAEMYRSRNVHNINPPATMKIFHRWEVDERALLIPPELAFPRMRPTSPPVFSLTSLFLSDEVPIEILKSYSSIKAVYTAVFLTPDSQWQLVSAIMPSHLKVYASHITLVFEPSTQAILEAGIGRKVTIRVSGSADNGKIQAVVVELPRGLQCQNVQPHVTVSAEEGVSPKLANSMLKTQPLNSAYQSQNIHLEGTIGLMVRETNEQDASPEECNEKTEFANQPTFAITSGAEFYQHVLPKLFQNAPKDSTEPTNESSMLPITPSDVQICTGLQTTTQLFIFDFDNTLIDAPDPREGRELYEKITGKRWPHKGWLSWPESLLAPMKVRPGPALAEFQQHLNRAGSHTVILTGRVERTEKAVLNVLENFQIYPQQLILKPDAIDETTPIYKSRIVRELLEEFPNVTLVKFWDDIPNNLAAIHRLSKSISRNIQFEIIDATKMLPATVSKKGKKIATQQHHLPPAILSAPSSSVLESYLASSGLLPSPAYTAAASTGIDFLASQFCKVIDFQGNPTLLVYPFGSSPLGRQSDIDMCFLAPPHFTPKDCIEKLSRQLRDCGVNYIHAGHSSRCPRLKVMLEFSHSPAVNYDMVFAIIQKEEFFTSPPEKQLKPSELTSILKSGESSSKVALTGPVLLQHVQEIISGAVSPDQFGAVVEMVAWVLIAHRQKGNAYHCIRTFHIVQLLANYIKTHKADLPSPLTCDSLFKEFVTHASKLPESKWQKLFGEFVPHEFIPRVVKVFSICSREASYDDFPSPTSYEEMSDRPSFPPDGCTSVELTISGTKKALLWKLHTVVEARLPSYIRQLLSFGLDVVPDGNTANEKKFCFAVLHTKSSKQTLQQVLRPFWSEISEFRKQSGVNVELSFGQSDDTRLPSTKPGNQDSQTATASSGLIERIMQFATGSSDNELHLSPSLTSYDRLVVHETAERVGLQHTTVGTGRDKHIVLRRKK